VAGRTHTHRPGRVRRNTMVAYARSSAHTKSLRDSAFRCREPSAPVWAHACPMSRRQPTAAPFGA
jgi:hypothetical protein